MIHLLCLTRFQLILPLFYKKSDRSQDARRGSPDIPNGPSDQSFRNMCEMQKLITWPGKSILCKKTLKTAILVDTILGYLTLEGSGRQKVDTMSTFGLPLNTWEYDGSN